MTLDLMLIRDFAIALFIGALVGVDREKKIERDHSGIGGLRTFILMAMAGAVSAWLSLQLGNHWIFIMGGIGMTALLIAGYMAQHSLVPGAIGLTTEAAAVMTYLLGGATLYGYPELAVALAIITSALLAFKETLHEVVAKLGEDDILAGLKLLIATFIVLPLLPHHTVDPWEALNPYSLWWMVILISSLSLVGYVAVRWLGPEKGTAVTGLFGGMVSSTAVSASFARQSKETPAGGPSPGTALATGILLAWSVMCAKMVVEVAVTYPPLTSRVAIAMAVMGISSLACAAVSFFRGGNKAVQAETAAARVKVKNPFSLMSAIKFGMFFAAVLLLVKVVQSHVSSSGLYLVSVLAGTTQVDAITLSMANFARGGGDLGVAATCIVLGALSNTVVKCGIVLSLGSGVLRPRVAIATGVVMAATLLSLLAV